MLGRIGLLPILIMSGVIFAAGQNVTVNPGGGSYATLGDAFTAINAGTHTGAVTVAITGDTTETATATLNASGTGSANYTSVVITPSGGARVISGTITGAIIRLNGADNVTIDGRIGGTGRNLTVSNASTATASAAIWLSSAGADAGATGNVIRNLEIAGGVTNINALSTFGIIASGTTISATSTSGFDNDNNQYIFNRVIRVRYGILTRGSSATNLNQNTVIEDNIVGPSEFGPDQIGKAGIIATFENNCNINRNTVQFVGGTFKTTTGGADRFGIGLGGESWATTPTNTTNTNFTVTRNLIHDVVEERTFSAVGIASTTTNAGSPTNNLIANNMVYNVRSNGTAGDQSVGIGTSGGDSDKIVFNSISLTGDVDPGSSTTSTVSSAGLRVAGTPTNLTLKNNLIYADLSSDTETLLHYAIVTPVAFAWGTGGSDNNAYFYNTGNPQMRFGGQGTATPLTPIADLAAWRVSFTPNQDLNSRFGSPGFISATGDLHINPMSPSVASDGGAPVAGVTNDFDNDIRSVTTPDIGADEGAFLPLPANDIGVSGILVPTPDSVLRTGSAITPQAAFSNLGTAAQTNIGVRFVISGPGFAYSNDQVIPSIASGGSATVTFAATQVVTATGAYTMSASILTPDSNPGNDSVMSGFQVVESGPFVVNTANDTADATAGDGLCADAGGMCSFRAAVSEANAFPGADVITLPSGTYTQSLVAANEDLNAGGDWDIRDDVTINGGGSATTILQAAETPGTATERVVESPLATTAVTINGVTLRHGNKTGAAATATRGGGIRNVGTLTMNDSVVTLNNASGAGGIRNEAHVTLNNVTVSNNACNAGGTTCFGGGMYNTLAVMGTIVINNSQFTGNTSTGPGANGFGFGAGMGLEGASGYNLTITNSTFSNNTGVGTGTGGSNGSGIRLLTNGPGTANITNSTFSGNTGTGGSSIQGQGITVFTSGAAGVFTSTWDGVTVSGNSGTGGGGVLLQATGGAMTLNIRNSTVSGNTSTGVAGGILMSNATAATGANNVINFVNSTISGNNASGNGGGVFIEQPAATGSVTANFNFATIANNRANHDDSGTDSGGGIFRSTAGTINLKNTLVADNGVGTGGSAPDISGSVTSEDYNHIEDLTGAIITGSTANNTTGDALLGALANNGGPTMTHLPGAGSIVINSIPGGTNDCGGPIITDQRGVTRPAGPGCEKGSVEAIAMPSTASISGQVTNEKYAMSRVIVVLSNAGGVVATRATTSFGLYSFPGVPTGQNYTVTVNAKGYTFTPPSRAFFLTGDLADQNFSGAEGGGLIEGITPAGKGGWKR